jgi:hypothetical protein
VDQGRSEFTDTGDAKQKLEELATELGPGREIKVTIAWRIEEDTTEQ